MTTTRTLIIGATAVAAGVAGVATLAATGSASADTAATSARDFTLRVHHSSEHNIDLGKTGFSAGDQDLVLAQLTRAGHHVGRLVGNCTTVNVAKNADQLCEFVLQLKDGQINASGTVRAGENGPGTFPLPIVGGTGRYERAAGQIAVTAGNGGSFPIRVSLR